MIYFTSDLHLFHDKPFIVKSRGFETIKEHNHAVIERINRRVKPNDQLYVLGDVGLAGSLEDICCELKRIKCGDIRLIGGNHDTDKRIRAYCNLGFKYEGYAIKLKLQGMNFFLSHYPLFTSNFDDDIDPKLRVFSLCGHTHTTDPFELLEKFGAYNVGVDAHDCYPVSIEEVVNNVKNVLYYMEQ